MTIPVLWQIGSLITQIEQALEKVYHYQKQLEEYSARTTSTQRREDVEAVLDELNAYATEFAKSGKLHPCSDVRIIFGLWNCLDTWHDTLMEMNKEDYLAVMDEHNTYENPMCYLLQPRLQAEGYFRPLVIPKEKASGFLETFGAELSKLI